MSKQKGFTLIEVSLAIVIGVIVLAGAIALYNQTKTSTGNAKAKEKVLRAAAVIESMAAEGGGIYPSPKPLQDKWYAVAGEDALMSPWGGVNGKEGTWCFGVAGVKGILEQTTWKTNPWDNYALGNTDYQGMLAYGINTPGATQSAVDYLSGSTKTFHQYVVGVIDPKGNAPLFPVGN
ncbi:type II secretion system protein [bacterium]|nr:type II secretion system protein [bacterium]